MPYADDHAHADGNPSRKSSRQVHQVPAALHAGVFVCLIHTVTLHRAGQAFSKDPLCAWVQAAFSILDPRRLRVGCACVVTMILMRTAMLQQTECYMGCALIATVQLA